MKTLVDTGAWVALNNSKDFHHQEALRFRDKIAKARHQLYTSNYILDETYTLLLLNVGYQNSWLHGSSSTAGANAGQH